MAWRNLMCNKVNINHDPPYKLGKLFISCNLTYLLTTYLYPIKLFCSIKFLRMFKQARDCTLTKGDLDCSIITNSENATPKDLYLAMNPWCICKKQENQAFHSMTTVTCNINTSSVNVGVSLEKAFSSWY